MTGRVVVLRCPSWLPAGTFGAAGWDALRSASVYAAAGSAVAQAVSAQGVAVDTVDSAADLCEPAALGDLVWLASASADDDVVHALAAAGLRIEVIEPPPPPAGAVLLDVVAVMDRLRSPGGCPWDAAQTHRSLMPYLLEEAYEAYQALEDGDLDALREELGDVLLQVVFHARVAAETDWSIDDVAGDLVAKLVRRHPHVFADAAVDGADASQARWDAIKRAEKNRGSVVDGIPATMPALMLAEALLRKASRAGLTPEPAGGDLGRRLFAIVAEACAAGIDAEAALRSTALSFAEQVRAAERATSHDDGDPLTD
ncbi:MAG: nucleoside triphosphate pyrophosphohydrolase [Pseudonocardiales bacterium]|nr:MAG: nucleoside triphosphate pyrophosphohydrolase [Pseudonocardiales bacterium]